MAAPEKWWVVGNQIPRTGRWQWRILNQTAQPTNWEFVKEFSTKAEAEAYLKKAESPITPPKIPLPKIPNPLSGIGEVGHWLGDAVLHITDGAMWRSLGWMLLGMLLIAGGVYLWFRTSATYQDLQNAALGTVKAL